MSAENKPGYIKQLDFLDNVPEPEFNFESIPTKTLSEFRGAFFRETMRKAGEIYVPDFSEDDLLKPLPYATQFVLFIQEERESLTNNMSINTQKPVTFPLESEDFKTDVRMSTWKYYTSIRRNTIEMGALSLNLDGDPNVFGQDGVHVTEIVLKINQMYMSGGKLQREKAVDFMLGQMLFYYWHTLKMRAGEIDSRA